MKKIIILIFIFIFFACKSINETENKIDNNIEKEQLFKFEQSYKASQEWMKNNLNSKWYFNYIYYPEKNTYSSSNNMIRQLMMSRILWELSIENINFREEHKKNLEYILKNWYKEDWKFWYVYFSNKSKLWANAMLLRVLIYSPFFDEYKDIAYKLANTIELSQKESWWFKAWYIESEYDFDEEYLLTFYSGEALLSIVEFYNKTWNEKYYEMAVKLADYYIEKYVENIEENYYPAYVPWHTIALNKLYKINKNKKYSEAIYILNDKLLEIQNVDQDSIFYWRFYNPEYSKYGSPHSSSDSVYTEWLIYAYEVAQLEKDYNHLKSYNSSIDISFINLLNLQYIDKEIENYKKLYWSIRYNESNYTIRVDTVSHFMDAVWKYLEILNK
jgi:hypothetical protein